MASMKNASPEIISLGTDDQSTRVIKPERDPIPQHLPKLFLQTRKGPTTPVLTSIAKLPLLLGSETFDQDLPYYNHQTRFLEAIAGEGNSCMVQRVVPADAGLRSNIVVYLDVLSTNVPNYVRNSLGDYVIDAATNAYKVDATTPTIPGVEIKYITEYATTGAEQALGLYTSKAGTMTDGVTTSTMYPLVELKAMYQGEYYNNIGFTIESLFNDNANQRAIEENKALTYNLGLWSRNAAGSTPTVLRSLFGEPSVQFTLLDKAKNPLTESRFDIETVFQTQWFNETDPLKSLRYNDYEGLYTYRTNLDLVLSMIMTNEKNYISDVATTWDDGLTAATSQWFDYTTADATLLDSETYLTNVFNCKSTKNISYFTVMVSTATATLVGNQKEVSISKSAPIFLNGGTDGTINNVNYETGVVATLRKYADSDSEVQDSAINVESIIYDSGFTLDTKKEFANFIGLRKDTLIVLSTHDDALGEKDLPLSDARAIAVALKTRLKLAPESEYYGTPVMRAVILAGTGLMRNGSTRNRIPLTYELAIKNARMLGAGDYKWKTNEAFDHGVKAIINELVDVSPGFIPAGIKPTLWADGIVWAQPKDRIQYFFPAMQTVYNNDTSVLNGWTTVVACATLDRIASDTWREFTGSNTLSNNEFIEAVLVYVNDRLEGIFGSLLTIVPEVVIDDADELRGYSWHLVNKIYAPNVKTKMVYSTVSYRLSDLTA